MVLMMALLKGSEKVLMMVSLRVMKKVLTKEY